MTEFRNSELRRLDLTVLLIFLGLLRHGKAARVAEEMGVTQSSISHALKRLREIFDDPLFLRRPHGLEPTARARALEPEIRAVVEGLERALAVPSPFDPETAEGTLRISALDYEIATVIPGLVARLAEQAPGVRLAVLSLGREAAFEAFAARRIDLALGYFWDLPERYLAVPLVEEAYLMVARAGHPLLEGLLTLERYVVARHLLVSPNGGRVGIVDKALRPLGLARRIAVSLPQFLPALRVVAETDLVAALPARLARAEAGRFGLETREL
ncbi:MAG: LysR family transcriptional regulator, partial [Pseudomonadota bacterium]